MKEIVLDSPLEMKLEEEIAEDQKKEVVVPD